VALNPQLARPLIQDFKFADLFREQLNWEVSTRPDQVDVVELGKEQPAVQLRRHAIAELGGVVVYEVTTLDGPATGQVPPAAVREKLSRQVQQSALEHVLIFVDKDRTQSLWQWMKRPADGSRQLVRSHLFVKGQPGDLFISKLAGLLFDVADFDEEGNVDVKAVADRLRQALDVEQVTKKFYREYQQEHLQFVDEIQGIADPQQRRWYASVLLHRLMFVYFLQRKQFLDKGNRNYLSDKYKQVLQEQGPEHYYADFLRPLFFVGFAKPEAQRPAPACKLLGLIPYLNGGLFLPHDIEEQNTAIVVPDAALLRILELFDRYSWNLNDLPGADDDEISPDVLGYIFEKYINQKEFGAYYTRPEITEYLCEQTIQRLVLERMQEPEVDAGTFKGKKQVLPGRHYDSLGDLLLGLDAKQASRLVLPGGVLSQLSLLDPACGSGAFLVAALKTLVNLYSALLGQIRVKFQHDDKLQEWLREVSKHRSEAYYIRRRIITDNLYGVDLMPEAVEIAKLRLFLALVATARTVDELEPLPNIDFNLLAGNSLVGLLRVDAKDFERLDLFSTKSYRDLVREKMELVRDYKNFEGFDDHQAEKRHEIQAQRQRATETMNLLLADQFRLFRSKPDRYGKFKLIQVKEHSWNHREKQLYVQTRAVTTRDVAALQPFHWSYEFHDIFERGGFDAIITNPPWDTLKPNDKEFFAQFNPAITRKMKNADFDPLREELLSEQGIGDSMAQYYSRFTHQSDYFLNVEQFNNQSTVVNGKRTGSDVDLYKLFTEQCYHLLKTGGYCGLVIPGGIYSSLGATQLRRLLFDHTQITGLFGFENRKQVFENVDSRFKFVVLTFSKSEKKTAKFPAAFMRHEVSELALFPKRFSIELTTNFIRQQEPETLALPEVKDAQDFSLVAKLGTFPTLGSEEPNKWQFKLCREFDMSGHSYLFKERVSKNRLPLYEGKLIHQFTHVFAIPNFWIDEREGREAVLGRTSDVGQPLDYQSYRIGLRDVAANTNERTVIATVLPPLVFCPHTMAVENIIYAAHQRKKETYYEKVGLSAAEQLYVVTLLNSYVVDFQARQKVTNHVSFFIAYGFRVPRLTAADEAFGPLVERAAKLICTTEEYADLWQAALGRKWIAKQAAITEADRQQLRAELDALVAYLYGLTEDEFTYVLSTFPLVNPEVKAAALAAYMDVATGHIA
jgi:type I restriction-modification system DNA methylase subunit